jgi:nicotinic acid mononucleotide adenylyltransferase
MNRKIVFAWGRFNPPTTGHKVVMDRVAKEAKSRNAEYAIFASKSNDPKKNPLTFRTKVKFLKQSFPKHSKNINASPSIKTVLDVMKFLDKRYQEVSLVVGSDRAQEFKRLLNQYNGKEYNFDEIEIISAGERDPDAEDVTGMSASKMRKFAVEGNYKEFKKGSPMKNPKELYNAIRRGMKINEEFCGIMNELHDITDKSIVGRKFNTMLRFGLVKTRDIPITQRSFKDMDKSGTNQELRKHIFDVTDKTLEYIMADDLLYRRFLLLLHDDFLMTEDHRDALLKKADKSRLSYSSLLEVFLRGLASSPIYGNKTAHQYAFDRVNSFIAGGHSRSKLDVDIWESSQQKDIRRKPMKRLRDSSPPAWGTKEMADRYSKVVPGQPDDIGEPGSREEFRETHGLGPDIIKKMKEVLSLTAKGQLDRAMTINDTLPDNAKKVLTKVKAKKDLEKYLKANEESKSERLAKIARAAKAGAENKAKEKAKATEKHNQNSAKSRAGIDYLKKGGNKDQFGRVRENTSDDDDDATFAKKRRTHVRNSARKVKAAMNDYGTNPSRKNAKRADAVNLGHDMVKRTWKDSAAKRRAAAKNEEVEQVGTGGSSYSKVRTGGSSYSKKGGSAYSKKGGSAYLKKGGSDYSKKGGSAYSKKGGSAYLKKRANEEVEQVDEISLKKKIQTYTKMAGDARVGDYDPDQSRKLEKRRAQRMLNKIEKKHGSKAASHAKRSADFDKDDANTYTSPREKRQDRQRGDPLASRQPVSTMKGGPRKGKVRPEDAKNRKFAMRQAARHRTARAALKTRNEEFEITESDKAEYDKLMKQYGDMPASKIPPKTYMRISQLGRKVRGDKGGPKVGDLLKSMKKKKMGEDVDQVDEATNKFPKWWEDDPRAVLTKVYHAKRQVPPKMDKKTWQKLVNVLQDKRPAPLGEYRRWSKMDPAKIQTTGSMKPNAGKQSAGKHDMSDAPIKGFKRDSKGKVIGEESIKINGGSAVEIGKNERGSKTQYYWKDKSGLKNVFDTPQKLRYSLRNDANFSGAEKAVKQLLGEAKMGEIARNVKKGDSPYTVVAIVNNKVVDQDHAKVADQVPALVRELKKEYPNAKISVEDRGGRVVHSESVNEVRIGIGSRSFRGSGMRTPVRKRDDEGYRKDGSNPVDDAIMKRNVARRKAIVRKVQADDNKNKDPKKNNEEVDEVDEGGLGNSKAGKSYQRTKPSQELAISRKEKRYFGSDKSLKDRKHDASKAERAKAKKQLKSFKEY